MTVKEVAGTEYCPKCERVQHVVITDDPDEMKAICGVCGYEHAVALVRGGEAD